MESKRVKMPNGSFQKCIGKFMMAFPSKTGVKGTSMQSGWSNSGEAQVFVAITRDDIAALLGHIQFAAKPRSSGGYSIQFLAHTVQLLTYDSGMCIQNGSNSETVWYQRGGWTSVIPWWFIEVIIWRKMISFDQIQSCCKAPGDS